ncbi:hypothetical protein [Nocardiopsis sp. NRRL B-16309]|uniref:hypothetical protein n=1 Tax=Nocardiopsis sp. NRRL B-16309 TaxID=1519494 RepID=UPI0009EB642F|nr:hypothetical protein [Nocardiopsis sp. NRRL B-16309]
MDITVHQSFLPHPDPGASPVFRRDALGLGAAVARPRTGGAEAVQGPVDRPYGLRGSAFRESAGDMLRIQRPR